MVSREIGASSRIETTVRSDNKSFSLTLCLSVILDIMCLHSHLYVVGGLQTRLQVNSLFIFRKSSGGTNVRYTRFKTPNKNHPDQR